MEVRGGQSGPIPRPAAKAISLAKNITLHPPLSRRGKGPGLLILVPEVLGGVSLEDRRKTLDPEPLKKWAEEGFAVVEVKVANAEAGQQDCSKGVEALMSRPECAELDKIGVIGICSPFVDYSLSSIFI